MNMQVWKYPPNRQPWVVTTQGWQILGLGLGLKLGLGLGFGLGLGLDNPGLSRPRVDD